MLLIAFTLFSQNYQQIDSLEQILIKTKADTSKIKIEIEIAELYGWNNTDKMIEHANRAKKQSEIINYREGLFHSHQILAMAHYISGKFDKGLVEAQKALKIAKEEKNIIWQTQTNNSIGLLYIQTKKYQEAIDYFQYSLDAAKQSKNQRALSSAYNNMANCYLFLDSIDKSLQLRNIAINIRKELDDKSPLGDSYNDLGETFLRINQYDSAIYYLNECLKIKEDIGDLEMSALSSLNLAIAYFTVNNNEKAKIFVDKSYELSKQIGAKSYQLEALKILADLAQRENNSKIEAKLLRDILQLRDSIFNEESLRQINQLHAEFDTEKKEMQIEAQKNEIVQQKRLANEKSKRNTIIIISFIIGIILLSVIILIVINRYSVTKKQKQLIEEQKNLVEEKQKEILDSITYAKRIQAAILPPEKFVKQHLNNSFILYRPKDIVAGDFYWLDCILTKENKELILFAAADCTGHGVPGAIVSVICHNALNRAVHEYGNIEPGHILDKTRELVISEFEKSEEEVTDGMDISLCCLNLSNNTLKWSGANNPLWIVRNGELLETLPDKQPIGRYAKAKPFTTHEIKLEKNDTFFIFTDGFQDQFGGEKGKKFKPQSFKQLLLSLENKSMDDLMKMIEIAFEDWMGYHEQIDDVCVIGVRI